MEMEIVEFGIGILIGELMDFIYDWKINGREGIHCLEHYHWGILMLMIPSPLVAGLGISLILDENRSSCRFAHGKSHFKRSSLIGVILFILLVLRWVLLCK